LTAKTAYQKSG